MPKAEVRVSGLDAHKIPKLLICLLHSDEKVTVHLTILTPGVLDNIVALVNTDNLNGVATRIHSLAFPLDDLRESLTYPSVIFAANVFLKLFHRFIPLCIRA